MNRDGSPIREDYGLRACALCTRTEPLLLSHIVPKFVFDWLKRTSATGTIRVGYHINLPVQDGFKTRLLCQDCEKRFSEWETPTARDVFGPLADRQARTVPYGPWLAKFAVSVSWRVLTVFRLGDALDDWPPPLRTEAETALRSWREFLNNERANPGRFEQHLIPFDLIEAADCRNLPPNANRYLVRAVAMDFARSDRSAFVYAKMGPLVLFGVINQIENVWKGTKVRMNGGIVGSEQYVIPSELGQFMWDRARRMREREGGMSTRQREQVTARYRKHLDRAAGSDTLRAMDQDVQMFGDAALGSPTDSKPPKG